MVFFSHMASTEAKPEVVFLLKPGTADEVVAQVTNPPISPHTIELGRREKVLGNLAILRRDIIITRAVVVTLCSVAGLDGLFRALGGVILSTSQQDLVNLLIF